MLLECSIVEAISNPEITSKIGHFKNKKIHLHILLKCPIPKVISRFKNNFWNGPFYKKKKLHNVIIEG